MEPMRPTDATRTTSLEPTPEEMEAGASLPREPAPEQVECRDTAAPPEPAVQSLIEKHQSPAHPGLALSIGVSAAVGPGIAVGAEASLGIVVDLTEPTLSGFVTSGSGTAIASGVSVGASGQVSLLNDVEKFWGSGAEHGVNLSGGGAALNHTTPAPGGELTLNGLSASFGPSVGVDAHYFEGTTERISLSFDDLAQAVKQVAGLPGPRRFGP
jgi:hypothetical protein